MRGYDGRMLRDVVTNDNTASDVWAAKPTSAGCTPQGKVSRIHRRKPKAWPMSERTTKANAAKSKVRVRVEHVFAYQKATMGLFIPNIGIRRAKAG